MDQGLYDMIVSELDSDLNYERWTDMLKGLYCDAKYLCDIDKDEHRWYDSMVSVFQLDSGLLIGIDNYHTTGDASIYDMGIVDDKKSINSIYLIAKKEVMTTVYSKQKEDK